MDIIGNQFGIKQLNDWYNVALEDIDKTAGGNILQKFGSSLQKALEYAYPEHKWNSWKFNWPLTKRKEFFDELCQKFNIKHFDEWYQIRLDQVQTNGGKKILDQFYDNSLIKALESIYPEREWHPWKFQQVSKGFWDNTNNQKNYFDWLGQEMGYKTKDDWYDITQGMIIEHHGEQFLKKHQGSPPRALQAIYPEHTWLPWKFKKLRSGFWDNQENARQFLNWLQKGLHLKSKERLKLIRLKDIHEHGGAGLLRKYGNSIETIIDTIFSGSGKSREIFKLDT